jgi:hypothetical protein
VGCYLENQFAIRVGQSQPGLGCGSPDKFVAELFPLEGETGIQVRHGQPQAVDFAKERWA